MKYKIKVPEINSKVILDRGETGKVVKYKSLGWGLPYYVIEYNDLSRNTQRWYDIDKFYSVVDLEIDVYDLDALAFYELQTVKVKAYKFCFVYLVYMPMTLINMYVQIQELLIMLTFLIMNLDKTF